MTNYEFKSNYRVQFTDYLNFRINNGYSLKSFYYLSVFDQFLNEINYDKDYIDKETIDNYCNLGLSCSKNQKIEMIKHVIPFLKYLDSIGIKTYIPTLIGKKASTVTYVLTHNETKQFFKSVDDYYLNKPNHYYYYEFPILFRLLYTTGLRVGEACKLTFEDLNLVDKTILVKEAKNLKDRYVYLSESFYELLLKYINKLKETYDGEWLFPTKDGANHLNPTTVDKVFNNIVKQIPIGTDKYHPVPHSLRHSYVVHRVDEWINENKNVDELMPYLSKQLGHSSIEGTYYYYHTISSSFNAISNTTIDVYPEVDYEKE